MRMGDQISLHPIEEEFPYRQESGLIEVKPLQIPPLIGNSEPSQERACVEYKPLLLIVSGVEQVAREVLLVGPPCTPENDNFKFCGHPQLSFSTSPSFSGSPLAGANQIGPGRCPSPPP